MNKLSNGIKGMVDANYDDDPSPIQMDAMKNQRLNKNKKRTNTRPPIIPKEQKVTSKEIGMQEKAKLKNEKNKSMVIWLGKLESMHAILTSQDETDLLN